MLEEEKLDDCASTKEHAANDAASKKKAAIGISRRSLCVGLGGVAGLLALGGIKNVGSEALVRPPGGQNEDLLLSACIRCEKCYEVCPRGVIAPAHLESGLLNLRTPVMDFSNDWCDWCAEENDGIPLCAQCCPTGALEMGSTPDKSILGEAVLNRDECLAYRLVGCRFCFDACEYDAILLDEDGCPYIVEEKCNGCGACESVCVSLQNASISAGATQRAIVVRPVGQ